MYVGFRIKNFRSYLPKAPTDVTQLRGDYLVINDQTPPLIEIAFNIAVKNSARIRIPITSKGSPSESSIYYIHGEPTPKFDLTKFIEKESKEPVIDPFSSIIAELHVGVGSHSHPTVMPRFSKRTIAFIDELQESMSYKVDLKNMKRETLVTFDMEIVSIDWGSVKLPKSSLYPSIRETVRKLKIQENLHFKQEAIRNSHKFRFPNGEDDDTECEPMMKYDIWMQKAFAEERPLNVFLMVEPEPTNEEHWQQRFEYVMAQKQVEYGVLEKYNTNHVIFYMEKMDAREQHAVYAEMMPAVSVNTTYVSDYILELDGTLTPSDDWSNICEACGDCDDSSGATYESTMAFLRCGAELKGQFKNEALAYMWKYMACRYICNLVLSALNRPWLSQDAVCCHLTALFLHKAWQFSHIAQDMIPDKETRDNLCFLREIEDHRGNLTTTITYKKKTTEQPMMLMGEGTGYIYPYSADDYYPPTQEKWQPRILKDGLVWPYIRKRMYHSKNWKFHMRYIMAFTNYYIEHPELPVNLPSFYFTYANGKEPNIQYDERGIDAEHMYLENRTPQKRPIRLVPQVQLIHLENSVEVMRNVAKDKFRHTPFYVFKKGDQTVVPHALDTLSGSPFEHAQQIIPDYQIPPLVLTITPNQPRHEVLPDIIPSKLTPGTRIAFVDSGSIRGFMATYKHCVVGRIYYDLTTTCTFYMILYVPSNI
jgi:hypothetical protein